MQPLGINQVTVLQIIQKNGEPDSSSGIEGNPLILLIYTAIRRDKSDNGISHNVYMMCGSLHNCKEPYN